jgi:hypothetical protein
MRRAAAAALLLLGACATGPTLAQRLSTFVGRGEGDLVAELGVPVRTYEAEGRRFLQYERRRSVLYPGYGGWGGPWGPGFGRYGGWGGWGAPPTVVVSECDITFALRGGRVEGFTMRGDACG